MTKKITKAPEIKDLYFVIENTNFTTLTSEEAEKFFKDKVYYTYWKDENYNNVYCFDLTRNSALPLALFLNTSEKDNGEALSPLYILGFIIILGLWIWWILGTWKEAPKVAPNSNFTEVIPVGSQIVSSNESQSWIAEAKPLAEPTITAVENETQTYNDPALIYQEYTNKLKGSALDLELCMTTNERLNLKVADLQSDFALAKEELKTEVLKTMELETQAKELQTNLLSDNQLYLYLWQKVFELCEDKPDSKCKDLIYQFYQLKK